MGSPFSMMLAMLFSAPMMLAQRGRGWYWGARATMAVTGMLAAAVWLAAPFAVWKAFGLWWTMLWLVPTTLALFATLLAPKGSGG